MGEKTGRTTVLCVGNPMLARPTRKVAIGNGDEFRSAVRDVEVLTEVLRGSRGVGLAANQVGISKSIAVLEDLTVRDDERLLDKGLETLPLVQMINPVITNRSAEVIVHMEGCLSIPGLYCFVERHDSVTVEWTNAGGEKMRKEFRGWPARIVQHEVDHLDGIVISQKAVKGILIGEYEYREFWREMSPMEIIKQLGADREEGLRSATPRVVERTHTEMCQVADWFTVE
ncbi:peptide deformylase [Micrococcus yunnanensis]|uniref:Peptide deformylase n=1 Tax=Micrococcus yunnanensis TaxID=566027 RepID=A0ABR6D3E2_9MICC|nr:peptide deformylase [Micrococcus yunnanensis]MBA9060635.1 peptide deformylase [Micrococcus yunnanensis]TFE80625.1 peptide deformylase [Micrococcus yunnanensis]